MSGKLDQSLDEILSTNRTRGGARGGRRVGRPRAAKTAGAPAGGIRKNGARGAKQATKATVPTGPASSRNSGSKIAVSNLPFDVTEPLLKDYFVQAVGPIKRVELFYGPNGQSRGIANITFTRPDAAAKASKELNGLLVDKKPMKIEVLLDASVAASLPGPKSLKERIAAENKNQPKSAAGKTAANGAKAGRGRGEKKGRGGRAGRAGRPAKKTAEELDSEMADYFQAGEANGAETAGASSGAAAPATNGDAMDEEIL